MQKAALAVTVAAALTVSGLGLSQGQTDSALDAIAQGFAAAYNAKDPTTAASFYAADAVLMPPNHPMIQGRDHIEAFFGRVMQAGVTNVQPRPVESAVSGRFAFQAGTGTMTLPDGRTESTKHLVVFRRVGDDWKIVYDMWNGNTPPPPRN